MKKYKKSKPSKKTLNLKSKHFKKVRPLTF